MKINNASLGIGVQLSKTSAAISRSLERLSSGKRVNSPADDPGAYNQSIGFDSQVRGLAQANLNINQTQGLLETADSGFSSQLDLLQRMREIALQATTGTLTSSDRTNLNTELQALLEQYRRIAIDTNFNGTKLLDGTFTTTSFQIGANKTQTIDFSVSTSSSTQTFRKDVGTGLFKTRATYTTGSGPYGLVTGDFNRDGNNDVITADITSNTLSVLAGKGDGTFQTRTTLAVGTAPVRIEAADINGDGNLDLLVANSTGASISVLKGNGDGTFQVATTVTVGAGVSNIQVGDFNGDKKLDFATTDSTDGTVSIVTGNGDGTFNPRSTLLVGSTPLGLIVADLNGDGKADVLASNAGSNTITEYFGQANGSFVIGTTITAGTAPYALVLGDFNADGIQDVAAANATTNNVSILINNGAGNFTNTATLTAGTAPRSLKSGDINGDGLTDLVVVNDDSRSASIFLGSGAATFTTGTTLTTGGTGTFGSFGVALSDFNNDGVLDIAQTDTGNTGNSDGTTLGIFIANTTNVTAEADVSVSTQAKATALLKIVDNAITTITKNRASVSAVHSRLESTVALNLLLQDNYADASSKLIDADLALETAELTKNQILQQAQVAVAAQANLQMQTVLGLLRF